MKRRRILVVAALVPLIALSIFPRAGQTTANAEGCKVFGTLAAEGGQTGDLGTIVSDAATAGPQVASTIILSELDTFCTP